MKLPEKLYYITDGNDYVLIPENELARDSDKLGKLFGLTLLTDIQLMIRYNADFRKQIADAYNIEPEEVKQSHVIRLASIKDIQEKNEAFSFPVELREGIFQHEGKAYKLIP